VLIPLFRTDAIFEGQIVNGVDYLDVLDKAISGGFWVNPQKLKDVMDDEVIAKNLYPVYKAAVIPAVWKAEKNVRPVVMCVHH
jgi:hypothetical protein